MSEVLWNIMQDVGAFFLSLVNRSIVAGWLVLAVLLIRYLLRKSPKWVSCLLWGIVAFRLICPFSFESAFSLISNPEPVPVKDIYSSDLEISNNPYHYQIQTGVGVIDRTINPVLTDTSGPALRSNVAIVAGLWLAGMAGMLLYGVVCFVRLRHTVKASVSLRGNVFTCDEVKSPFILGIAKPRIYLPSGMEEETVACVIAHENTHLKRRDHWWKPLGYLLLAVYWFHPFCWLAYKMFCKDMELACDEKAVRDMGRDEKAAYAQALLDCSIPRRMVRICPLAFGEIGVKERVRKVLDYKRPAFWVSIAAAAVCAIAAVCLLTDPKAEAAGGESKEQLWFHFPGEQEPERRIGSIEEYEPREINIEAFPGVIFRWGGDRVEAVDADGEVRILYTGRAVWSAGFADLNGDGKPELCSVISAENEGTDIIDNRVVVYDYEAGVRYELAAPGEYDYTLLFHELTVMRCSYGDYSLWEEGKIVFEDGQLTFFPTGSMRNSGSMSSSGGIFSSGAADASGGISSPDAANSSDGDLY